MRHTGAATSPGQQRFPPLKAKVCRSTRHNKAAAKQVQRHLGVQTCICQNVSRYSVSRHATAIYAFMATAVQPGQHLATDSIYWRDSATYVRAAVIRSKAKHHVSLALFVQCVHHGKTAAVVSRLRQTAGQVSEDRAERQSWCSVCDRGWHTQQLSTCIILHSNAWQCMIAHMCKSSRNEHSACIRKTANCVTYRAGRCACDKLLMEVG